MQIPQKRLLSLDVMRGMVTAAFGKAGFVFLPAIVLRSNMELNLLCME